MLPPYYFYWSRIDNKHMTEPWLDQTLMDSAFRSGVIIPNVKAYKSCLLVTDFLTVKLASVYIYSKCFRILIHSRTRLKYSGLDYSILNIEWSGYCAPPPGIDKQNLIHIDPDCYEKLHQFSRLGQVLQRLLPD